jgi:hypothetical protein
MSRYINYRGSYIVGDPISSVVEARLKHKEQSTGGKASVTPKSIHV